MENNVNQSQYNTGLGNFETEIDHKFILDVQREVTQSCALPFALPIDRIPSFIIQAAKYFWMNDDFAIEERHYIVKNRDICKGNGLNKIIQLPQQIMSVHGVYKINDGVKYGTMGDFSLERMMMSSYSMFGGAGIAAGSGFGLNGGVGYTLPDVVVSMYEVDTFNQTLNAPLTYNYNTYSSKLVLLGDLGYTDILIACCVRCKIQDLYNNIYFFKKVVSLCEYGLSDIYGMYEFKLPGGVSINYSKIEEKAQRLEEEVKEWLDMNKSADYFFMPNTL